MRNNSTLFPRTVELALRRDVLNVDLMFWFIKTLVVDKREIMSMLKQDPQIGSRQFILSNKEFKCLM